MLLIKKEAKLKKYDVIVAGSKGRIGQELVNYLKSTGHDVLEVDLSLGHDLSNERWVTEFFEKNRANSLVNLFAANEHITANASMAKSIMDFTLDDIDKYLHVNLTALFSVCRQFAKNNKNSSIINFSSIYGVRPPKKFLYDGGLKHIGYAISKSGVLILSEYLALNLAPDIRVNTVIPGGIVASQPQSFLNKYASYCPMGRMGEPSDLFGIVDLLISNKSSYITGAEFRVDGGWLI